MMDYDAEAKKIWGGICDDTANGKTMPYYITDRIAAALKAAYEAGVAAHQSHDRCNAGMRSRIKSMEAGMAHDVECLGETVEENKRLREAWAAVRTRVICTVDPACAEHGFKEAMDAVKAMDDLVSPPGLARSPAHELADAKVFAEPSPNRLSSAVTECPKCRKDVSGWEKCVCGWVRPKCLCPNVYDVAQECSIHGH